jgi:hypothetical protein
MKVIDDAKVTYLRRGCPSWRRAKCPNRLRIKRIVLRVLVVTLYTYRPKQLNVSATVYYLLTKALKRRLLVSISYRDRCSFCWAKKVPQQTRHSWPRASHHHHHHQHQNHRSWYILYCSIMPQGQTRAFGSVIMAADDAAGRVSMHAGAMTSSMASAPGMI